MKLTPDFSKRLDGVRLELGCPVDIVKAVPKHCRAMVHRGQAVCFRLCLQAGVYAQSIKILNACNEYFKMKNKLKYRLGVFPKDSLFYLDAVQGRSRLFWVCRDGKTKTYNDMTMFLMDLFEEEG